MGGARGGLARAAHDRRGQAADGCRSVAERHDRAAVRHDQLRRRPRPAQGCRPRLTRTLGPRDTPSYTLGTA
eukprot:scaffold37173_cov69-Phaeocystis_antarctica.AAC.3